ncbi:MAG: ATP-binding protein [Acidobacteriota bacterium]
MNEAAAAVDATSPSAVQVVSEYPALAKDDAPNLALPWVVRLRYGMLAWAVATLGGAAWGLGLRSVSLWVLLPLVCVLMTNFFLHRASRGAVRSPQAMLGAIFTLDTLCLTFVLALTGGPMNPFSLLYLVQITLAAVVLERSWTWALGGLSVVCFGLLFFLRLPFRGFHVSSAEQGFLPHLVGMWFAFVIAVLLISFFTSRVTHALRLREQEVRALQERLAKHQRLTSLATLAAGAAHELGTPLGTIAVIARELERYASTLQDGEALREDANLIRSQVERCQRILQRMSADGAEPVGESPRTIAVGELLQQTLHEISAARRSQIRVEAIPASAALFLPVRATVQSLTALVSNALDSGPRDVEVVLKACSGGSTIAFSVCDNGTGMPEDVLRRVTEPFFTTKEPGRGMGLGTFLARSFAERLGGDLTYASSPGRGTTATLTLPARFAQREADRHG